MNTTPTKWIDPPMLVALAASYIAGAILAFYLTASLLIPYLGDLHLPPLPFPGGAPTASLPGGTPLPSATFTPQPSLTTSPTVHLTEAPTHTHTPTATASQTPTPSQTATKTLPPLPPSAQISGVVSYPMISLLDCEARAAVDWAGFFGTVIDERDFLSKMPTSDNPEKGFVGHWYDPAGNIPPGSYGIHAKPLAGELNNVYKVKATARKHMQIEDLLYEIAAGRPVIVWVVGPVQAAKIGVEYTAPDGEKSMVAPYEHTVMLVGYDENSVTVVDGGYTYYRTKNEFLISWAQLDNMAIIRGE